MKKDVDQGDIKGTTFPYESYAKASVFYDNSKPDFDNGLVTSPSFYFTPAKGSVPYLQNLSVTTTVTDSKSDKPYSAIADAGVQGLTKEELNLVVCLINAQRYKSCLPPLALNSQLIAAAQAHSYEMNRVHNMSHYSSAGDISMRLKRRGFSFSKAGENVAYGIHDAYSMYVKFAESQLHLDNILDPEFALVGSGRSGQYWTINFGTYMDKDAMPNQATLPLCPGNATDIKIAFPSGLPKEPKLEKAACGNTEATSVTPPPYIQTSGQENPPDSTTSPVETDGNNNEGDCENDGGTDNYSTEIPDNDKPTNPQENTNGDVVVSGYVNYVVVTETVVCTVYVDGDALNNQVYGESKNDQDSEDNGYSAHSLDDGKLNIIVTPNYVEI
ncbi:hypothetical protein COEREDRAFT_17476 [Coemansia reversa NRRL 1564]|uniref:SCP domain-containing protein n=1 Tax=Coemansia reversa (strain ATCC 12441 / NRRL 1564) TaxID=763665 RepID=A0A2G5B3J0_COERN|nr:hypothetical protein COEREDRAFT_17476 [Coemansia reversa NRRL 1564]|eukprot:PIA13593.1 hypothetical protein COEREDRAFT_17476 [Coemansia reversa NRRL 1564]